MARAYSGVLAALAVIFVILSGLMAGSLPDQILSRSLVVFIGFAVLGYMIGSLAEQTVCDSVENRFRNEIKRLRAEASASSTENAE